MLVIMKKLHSIDIIEKVAKRNKSIKEFKFVAYHYVPQALTDKGRTKFYLIKRNPITTFTKRIQAIRIPEGWSFAILSEVRLMNDKKQYIPQIDFQCSVSGKNINLIKKRLSEIVKVFPGYILKSGNSYHYIGIKLLNKEKFIEFIGNCLLCNIPGDKFTLVDTRWFGHALRNGYACLRIFKNIIRPEPEIVAFI